MRVHMYQVWYQRYEDLEFTVAWTAKEARAQAKWLWEDHLTPSERRYCEVYAQGFDFNTNHVPADILEEYGLDKGFDPRAIPESTLMSVLADLGEDAMEAPYNAPIHYRAKS